MQPLPRIDSSEILRLRPSVIRPEPADFPLGVEREIEPVNKDGAQARVLTLFLRGSECSFRCLMCDLWRYTLAGPTPLGSLPKQIEHALTSNVEESTRDAEEGRSDSIVGSSEDAAAVNWIKLYNAANFFAPQNVPKQDLPLVAQLVSTFHRVIVENHPKLNNSSLLEFRDQLEGRLEIAMGLETIHPATLARLNKQMTPEQYQDSCEWLTERGVDVRAFVLLRPPGMDEDEGVDWCIQSIKFADKCGARHISVIPMRSGNGTLEHLQSRGLFQPPRASSLETVMLTLRPQTRAVLTADLWDWGKMEGHCPRCRQVRLEKLERANLTQKIDSSKLPHHCMHCLHTD